MTDRITTTTSTTTGWCERIGDSFKGIVVAIVLFIIGCGLLIWNETNAVVQYKTIQEGIQTVVEVTDPTTAAFDPTMNNQLVHVIGYVQSNNNNNNNNGNSDNSIRDSEFGIINVSKILKLQRTVEMYQWVETSHTQDKKNTGGSTTTETTYEYHTEWTSNTINSNHFYDRNHHTNPTSIPFRTNQNWIAANITLGSYQLSSSDIMNKLDWYVPFTDYSYSVDTIPSVTKQLVYPLPIQYYSGSSEHHNGNGYYIGTNMNYPQVGDIRILYNVVPEQTISIIGRQTAGSFTTYTGKSGGAFLLVEPGIHDTIEMFQHATTSLQIQTWILRVVGFGCIFIGFQLLVQPLIVFADVLPCIGNIVEAGTSCINFMLAAILSIIIIAIAWLANRPILAFGLLAGTGILIYSIYRFTRSRGSSSTTSTTNDFTTTYESIPTAEQVNYYDYYNTTTSTTTTTSSRNDPSFAPSYIPEAVPYVVAEAEVIHPATAIPIATMVQPTAPYEDDINYYRGKR